MTIMDGDDMQRLWSLIEDLTNQLQANRQLCESLQQQADQLRGQAIHSGTGFALRRFNTDLSKEKFESELEALNAHLVKENLGLSHENKQQAVLLREYENTLETVMAKFRSFSHSTQQHTLQLTQHYESLLAQTTHNAAEQTLAAETAFSGTLTHLGGLVRRAMQSLDGEVSDESGNESGDEREHAKPSCNTTRGWMQDPRWYGSGGYTGKTTDPVALRADEALEQLTEEERLRMENDTLRELLGLKEKSDALLSAPTNAGGVPHSDAGAQPPSKPMSPAERRASLTVDEAAIAAEASGQPPYKALQVSSTTRPGESNVDSTAVSPSRASPKLIPSLERKEQIIEEAILAEDEGETDRGRRAGGSSPCSSSIASDDAATGKQISKPSATSMIPVDFAADDADTAPSSIEELRAAAKQEQELSQAHAALPTHTDTSDSAGTDADEIMPIDEMDLVTSAEPATSAGPNMIAEAAPPAFMSTGMEETDTVSSKTTVTSASGIDVAEAAPAPVSVTSGSEASCASVEEPSASMGTDVTSIQAAGDDSVKDAKTATSAEEIAPPAESAETLTTSEASSSGGASKADEKEVIPATESSEKENQSVSSNPAADAATDIADSDTADTQNTDADVAAETIKDSYLTTATPAPANQGRKDGAASPAKKGRGNRGKGNRHHKSNSSVSNKASS